MALDQQKTIILLAAILLAVVATSLTVLFLLPNDENNPNTDVPNVTTVDQSTSFNLNVLERSDFNALNHRLIQERSLPVQPPSAIGKANPFL